jgi:protein-disulfide isomerase
MSGDRQTARTKARELREAEARHKRRREQLIRFGVLTVVAVALLAVGIAIFANRPDQDAAAALPAGVTAPAGGVVIGDESAPVTVDLWIDFQCPFCRAFEQDAGSMLEQLAADGAAVLAYHPLSFLGEESERAANAFGCAADQSLADEYQRVLFENQPPEGTGGFTTTDLVALGADAGITGSEFESCVQDGRYADWVANVAASQSEAGIVATPTVFIDGDQLAADQLTPEGLQAAVTAAAES